MDRVHSATNLASSADSFFTDTDEERHALWSKRLFDLDTDLDILVSAISSGPREAAHIFGSRSRITQNPSLFSPRRRHKQFRTLASTQ